LKKARKLADTGDINGARDMLMNVIKEIESSVSASDTLSQEFIKDLKDAYNDMHSKQSYKEVGQKKMLWKEQGHSRERAADSAGASAYSTKSKFQMKQKALTTISSPMLPNVSPIIMTDKISTPMLPNITPIMTDKISTPILTNISPPLITIQIGNTHKTNR